MDRLQQILQVLARPIEFASRDSYARFTAVKDLGPFVCGRVIEALSERVYLPTVEADLLSLRELFTDFDERLGETERKRRLSIARALIDRLSQAGSQSQTSAAGVVGQGAPTEPAPPVELWDLPIRFARGVGPKRAALLERLGVRTVEDALWYLPWRYEDRSVITPIGQLRLGIPATISGIVQRAQLKRTARRNFSVFECTVQDPTGIVTVVYFNQPYLADVLCSGHRVMLSGPVSAGRLGWTDLRMETPQYELLEDADELPLHVGRIVPIYHETKGLTSRQIRVLQHAILDQYLGGVDEVLPPGLRLQRGLLPIRTAIPECHFPGRGANLPSLQQRRSPAHRRLAFEELFLLQVALGLRKQAVKAEVKGIRFEPDTPLLQKLTARLPYHLTAAQQRVLREIQCDMASPRPMHRLIQGDVGCGKTIVAVHAMLIACGSSYQAALMVPTEILAEQHYLNLRPLLEALGLRVALLRSRSASTRTVRQADVLAQIANGEVQVVVGTHALIQKGVTFSRLGLAVIDEQHKFGVLQRKTLLEKGYRPDVLVMTATPIPRSLAMTAYGDLDLSVIDALPPGRRRIRTWLMEGSQRRRAYQMVQDEIRQGRQGYIVYPLVEESEKVDLRAAMQAAERLQAKEFRSHRVGLLHGRLKSNEKERIMAAFKAGEIHVLVATTVVEVGVDVPNATVMLIEHAERFGLAQLHQLRGRVGRGAHESTCILLASGRLSSRPNAELSPAQQRMAALVNSSDGFVIAEEDLRIRGPGEFFGVRQWGLPELRVADLVRDSTLLQEAREESIKILTADPGLTAPAHRGLREAMLRRWQSKLPLAGVG